MTAKLFLIIQFYILRLEAFGAIIVNMITNQKR